MFGATAGITGADLGRTLCSQFWVGDGEGASPELVNAASDYPFVAPLEHRASETGEGAEHAVVQLDAPRQARFGAGPAIGAIGTDLETRQAAKIAIHTSFDRAGGFDAERRHCERKRIRKRGSHNTARGFADGNTRRRVEAAEPRPPTQVVVGDVEDSPQFVAVDVEMPRAIEVERSDHNGSLSRSAPE